MYCYRITKYNPNHRDEFGAYMREEWISLSDVGLKFNGKIFELEEYIRTENLYLSAIVRMMNCLQINGLTISNIIKYRKTPQITAFHEIYTDDMIKLYRHTTEGQIVSGKSLEDLCKLRLRQLMGFRLIYENKMYVHFGYDYYMYIGVSKECMDAINSIQASGLFVEECESPYYLDDED